MFIIFTNAWGLVFFNLLLTFQSQGAKRQKSFILYQQKDSFNYYLVKKWGAIVTPAPIA